MSEWKFPPTVDDEVWNDFLDRIAKAMYDYEGYYWHTRFESLDGYVKFITGNGSIDISDGTQLTLATGDTNGDNLKLYKAPNPWFHTVPLTWEKRRRFKTKGLVWWYSNQWIWIITGYYGPIRHVGFLIQGNELYGSAGDGVTEKLELMNIPIVEDSVLELECIFTPGVEAECIAKRWLPPFTGSPDLTDTVKVTENLPTGTGNADRIIELVMWTGEDSVKKLSINDWKFLQEP